MIGVPPGLIDIHVHVYPRRGEVGPSWQHSVIPDAPSCHAGVTTFVRHTYFHAIDLLAHEVLPRLRT